MKNKNEIQEIEITFVNFKDKRRDEFYYKY